MKRPLLLDLFCGAGGASMGYYRAGFDVIGVDINPQPNFPFFFVQSDALEELTDPPYAYWKITTWKRFFRKPAAIHASPPCQRYTSLAKGNNANVEEYPDLLADTRELLQATGLPYVIENVQTAPLIDPITLCGEMFGLDVIRHRKFESSVTLEAPPHKQHRGRVSGYRHGQWYDGPYFAVYGNGGGKGTLEEWRSAMGIDWMTKPELAQAIPPSYTEHVGAQLLDSIRSAA